MDTTPYRSLKVSLHAHRVEIELNHGRANEMGRAEIEEWETLTDRLEDADVSAIVTWSQRRTPKGTPIFISGANVTERTGWSEAEVRSHVRWQRETLAALRRVPQFHVAVIGGVALGWGTEFCIAADYRIATEEATFALPETGIGILPGAGGTSELWAIIGVSQALRLGMTGEQIDAREALRIGLVQEVVPDVDAGLARARALADRVARRSPTAIGAMKRALLAGIGCPPAERAELEAGAYELCLRSGDAAIGRENFKAITAGEAVPWGPRAPFSP